MTLATAAAILTLGQGATATLDAGTPVRLVLLKELGSGLSRLGEEAPFVVAEDVKDAQGKVLIESGTLAVAKVVQVRREGALSAPILDRPARLAIQFDRTWAADLKPVPLKCKLDAEKDKELQLTRVKPDPKAKEPTEAMRKVLETPGGKEIVTRLAGILQGKSLDDAIADPAKRSAISNVAQNLGFKNVYSLLEGNRLGELPGLVTRLRGGNIIEMASGVNGTARTALVALRALREIAGLGSNTLGYVGDRFKGRNINIPVGHEVVAYVAEPVTVSLGG